MSDKIGSGRVVGSEEDSRKGILPRPGRSAAGRSGELADHGETNRCVVPAVRFAGVSCPPWRQPRGKSQVNLPQMPPESGGILWELTKNTIDVPMD